MLKWMIQYQKRLFFVLLFVCLTIVLLQYNYNYFSNIHRPLFIRHAKFFSRSIEVGTTVTVGSENWDDDVPSPLTTSDPNEASVTVTIKHNTCKPNDYVLFLKTHKTGSSTITNILNRYADKHHKSILLPKGAAYYSFDWPNKFRLSFSLSTFNRPNFLANHARYSRKSMNVLFPRESTTYISVLRHPVTQWESTFQYMSFPYILDIADKYDPLDFFLNNPPSPENIMEISRRYPSLYLIRNPLFFDLGLDYKHYDNATFIRRALKTLDDDFDLVLIMEHFDESLTLLRRRLCWEIDDVVSFKMNERLHKHKLRVLSDAQTRKIKNWNNADTVLYNYFVEKFWKEVKNEGPGFYDEVSELRRRRKYYSDLCIEREAVEEAYSSVFVKGYKIRADLTGDTKLICERMLKNELHYMDYFRLKRYNYVNAIEGVNIENFENSTEELEILVETNHIPISNYYYGRVKPAKTIVPQSRNQQFDKFYNSNRSPHNRSTIIDNGISPPSQTDMYDSLARSANKYYLKQKQRKKRIKSKLEQAVTLKVIDELATTKPVTTSDIVHDTSDNGVSTNLSRNELKYDGKTIVTNIAESSPS